MLFKLSRTIRHEGNAYRPGDERALVNLLSDEQKRDYISRGLLEPVAVQGVALDGARDLESVKTQLADARDAASTLMLQNERLKAQLNDAVNQGATLTEQHGELADKITQLSAEKSELEDEMASLDTRLESVSATISGAGFTRLDEENPLVYLERYAAQVHEAAFGAPDPPAPEGASAKGKAAK